MTIIKKLLFILSAQERNRAYLLILMIMIMGVLDMLGVASILPFMAVLTNPNLIETNYFLNSMYKFSIIFGVEDNQQFLFALGVLVFIILVLSLIFKAITTYAQLRFVHVREYTIGRKLIEGYLRQPYSWFLNRHSADIGKSVLSEVAHVISACIKPLMDIIAKGTLVILLIILLIVVDPKLAITTGLTIIMVYLLIFKLVKKYLNKIGNQRVESNEERFKVVLEAFGASKEIKVGGLEGVYIKLFSKAAKVFAVTQASAQVINQLPKIILEIFAFGGILLLILYKMTTTGNFNTAIPIISLYVFAGYRLLPAIQQIYASFSNMSFAGSSLDRLFDDFKNFQTFNKKDDVDKIVLNKMITLKNISYSYPNSSRSALKNISLNIPVNSTVGFVGATGSGKTTTVDIILGLLEAQKGTLEVDDKIITNQNSRSWQKSIGYVPQNIYLSDGTVEANIAFGQEINNINYEAVERAAKIANLHDFVIEELPNKYQTTIGERGVGLSGGQRQRIGIARALYHDPQVLILDEATSALDNETEQAVMEAVNNIDKDVTIILIAHRLNTVKNCDNIFKFKKGCLIGQGTFDEIISINKNDI